MERKTKNREVDLGKDSIGGLMFKLAMPSIIAQIINLLYNLVDRMYIGHIENIGDAALTGVGVTMPLIMAITAFASLVSMGGAPRASIMMGKGDKRMAENILGNCTAMLIIISVVITTVIEFFGRDVLMFFGASENTIGYAWGYMQIYALGTIFVQLALGLNAFINAQGFAKMGMITVVIGAICNIILDPIFIFGFKLGVRGAAIATIISQAVSCIWIIIFLTGKKTILKLKIKDFKLKKDIVFSCISLGLSPFIMMFTESVLFICFNTSLLKYGGDIAVGSMAILSSIMQFAMLPLQGMTQGAQPIISYNFGAGNIKRVKKAYKLLLVMCLGYSTVLWAVAVFAPKVFVMIFTNQANLTEYACWAMRVYMAGAAMLGIQIACQQTFIALGNAKTSVFLALLRKVFLLIPLIFILPLFIKSNQVFAVFLAEPISDIIAACTTATLFFIEYRKLKEKV